MNDSRQNTPQKPPIAMLMVGSPCCGKSHWIDHVFLPKAEEEFVKLSTDDVIERIAKKRGISYTEAFNMQDVPERATNEFWKGIESAKKEKKNMVIDRTNLTDGARETLLSNLPEYTTVAVDFMEDIMPNINTLAGRIQERARTGKDIPLDKLQDMLNSYERPGEEFDVVVRANLNGEIKRIDSYSAVGNQIKRDLIEPLTAQGKVESQGKSA